MMLASTEVLRHELGIIGARLAAIQDVSPWRPTPEHPDHGAEVAALNRRSVHIIEQLAAARSQS